MTPIRSAQSYICLALLMALFGSTGLAAADPPLHVYLTWQGDTSRTMTVTFQTGVPLSEAKVHYGVESQGRVSDYSDSASADSFFFEGLRRPRYVHSVELTGLRPGTAYYFRAGDAREGFSDELKFRTIPAGDVPIRFVTGGDMDVARSVGRLLAQAGKFDPMFCVIGGDMAYGNADLRNYKKWDRWIKNWSENLLTTDGFMVPMVLAIGNHEVRDGYAQPRENAPFYFNFFPQGGRSYFSQSYGDNVALLALDTGHIMSHESQVAWLDQELRRFADVPQTFAVYHIPLYPSHRSFDGGAMIAGRKHWAPLFDRYGLTATFENHDHTLKRTPRIKANRINPEGTLYLGDGCFGQDARVVDEERRWYEEVAISVSHFWVVEATADGTRFRAIGINGEELDAVSVP